MKANIAACEANMITWWSSHGDCRGEVRLRAGDVGE